MAWQGSSIRVAGDTNGGLTLQLNFPAKSLSVDGARRGAGATRVQDGVSVAVPRAARKSRRFIKNVSNANSLAWAGKRIYWGTRGRDSALGMRHGGRWLPELGTSRGRAAIEIRSNSRKVIDAQNWRMKFDWVSGNGAREYFQGSEGESSRTLT